LTAAIVAAARGVGVNDELRDPLAFELALGRPRLRSTAVRRGVRATLRIASVGLIDHVSLRMAAIDCALEHAVRGGVRQLVLLGAGFDTRAFRIPWLAGVCVFEVDHPATQEHKRARVRGWQPFAARVRFAAVDFARDSIGDALDLAGHDAEARTFWIWGGVTPYLDLRAIEATLAAIAARSACGSTLAVTYLSAPPPFAPLSSGSFAAIGEPLRSVIEVDRMTRVLAARGFAVVEDSDSRAWAASFGTHPRLPRLLRGERLVVARRLPPV
jgi:methyltransferase (TIGR00027 family)